VTEREHSRTVAHRLAVLRHAEEVSRNVSLTCRYYDITRTAFYRGKRRYAQLGEQGLRDRSSRPRRSPRATSAGVVGKIVYLRQHYHFGPLKIAMYLKRYHDISLSQSGIWRILRRLGLGRLPASQRDVRYRERWKRYEKPEPGHQVQIDVKFIAPLKGSRTKHYQFTAIDDCTRLRVLRIYDQLGQKSAIQFVDYVLEKLPFHVLRIQTDNGSEFQARFHWHVLDRGIDHVYINPSDSLFDHSFAGVSGNHAEDRLILNLRQHVTRQNHDGNLKSIQQPGDLSSNHENAVRFTEQNGRRRCPKTCSLCKRAARRR
jgi:transposase